ncbi:lysM and putative peptidoglycan-binding domain-containing protein 1 [Gastrophryne carolinensis]
MASTQPGNSGLLRGTRTRSYGSLVQSPYSPARIRKLDHLVQPGDTLQGLALKYGVTMEQIKRANRLYTNDSIFLKKFLSIPVLAEQPDLSNGGENLKEDSAVTGEGASLSQPERQEKSRPHRSDAKDEVTASDFMTRMDTRIRVSKRAAVKKMREVESIVAEEDSPAKGVAGYQSPCTGRSREGSPQTQQRSLLGPVPLTVTTRTTTLREREDEIFKL